MTFKEAINNLQSVIKIDNIKYYNNEGNILYIRLKKSIRIKNKHGYFCDHYINDITINYNYNKICLFNYANNDFLYDYRQIETISLWCE